MHGYCTYKDLYKTRESWCKTGLVLLHIFSDQYWGTGARRVKLMLHLVLNMEEEKKRKKVRN